MTRRVWDPENTYAFAEVKAYTYWTVDVSVHQHTLGSFIIFCNRKVQLVSELVDEELLELKRVMKDMEDALQSIDFLRPDHMNYFQMGNALHHLHFHSIPRYETARMYEGELWEDTTWGDIPVWQSEESGKPFVEKLRDQLQTALDSL